MQPGSTRSSRSLWFLRSALIKTLPVVFVGRIDALQGEVDEAILLPWRLRLSGRIVALGEAKQWQHGQEEAGNDNPG